MPVDGPFDPVPRLTLPSVGRGAPVGLDEQEPADYASDSVELLAQEGALRHAVPAGAPWQKLVRNFVHFVEDVLEGWIAEGRTFPSERAKHDAIGDLVSGTIERIRRDPRGWMRAHCDRR